MNISLNVSKKNKNSRNKLLNFGLNDRKKPKIATKTSTISSQKQKNVFDDDSDDESDSDGSPNNNGGDPRTIVNQHIKREQEALRRRAQAELEAVPDTSVYDYDAAYDAFSDQKQQEELDNANKKKKDKSSQYIQDLLKTAQQRKQEREVIYERKVIQEQKAEDQQEEYLGKEKFVTQSYKRKLQERKQWATRQKEKEHEEKVNDVTKQTQAGAAFAKFYTNLNRHHDRTTTTTTDTTDNNIEDPKNNPKEEDDQEEDFDPRQGFLGGFERSSVGISTTTTTMTTSMAAAATSAPSTDPSRPPEKEEERPPPPSQREQREQKVAAARVRYRQRQKTAHQSQEQ